MNRDISQLIAILAGMQGDIASLRTGIAALDKDVQKLAGSIQAADPGSIARAVRAAASDGAASEVARAANSARSASDSAERIAAMAISGMRLKRRWKAAVIVLAAVLAFGVGFGSSSLLGVWDRYGCLAHGGEWLVQPTVTACAFR